MDWEKHYSDTPSDNVIEYRHKIAVVELNLEDYIGYVNVDKIDLDSIPDAFYTAIANQKYERSTQVELHFGSEILDDKINLSAYLHETSAECDVSYPLFTYDELYGCWIVKQKFWGAPFGIDGNGIVLILDFSAYD